MNVIGFDLKVMAGTVSALPPDVRRWLRPAVPIVVGFGLGPWFGSSPAVLNQLGVAKKLLLPGNAFDLKSIEGEARTKGIARSNRT
jgi:hypothetical protein